MGRAEPCGSYRTRTPKYAPDDFRSLPPCEKTGPGDTYVGSGIPLREHPLYKKGSHLCIAPDMWRFACQHCGSENTHCIYFSACVVLSGKDHTYELHCQECGGFTTYRYAD